MIQDYTSLITEIISWVDHDEVTTAVASTLLNLGEKRVYREIKVTEMETAYSATISGGVAALPSDFAGFKVIDSESLFRMYPTRSSDSKPYKCAIDGGNLEFGPYPDSNYVVKGTYYARPTSLSSSNTTSYFTDEGGDALFFASLVNAEPFLKNDPRINTWEGLYQRAKMEIMKEQKRKRLNGSPKYSRAS